MPYIFLEIKVSLARIRTKKIRHHADTIEDDEPPRKRVKEENEDS